MVAQEFRKLKEPKIQTLSGGYSTEAILVFRQWKADIEAHVHSLNLDNNAAIQVIRDKTEKMARDEVAYYLEVTDIPTWVGLLSHLQEAFCSGDSPTGLLQQFYSRTQKPKETEDTFANDLQRLARKVLIYDPSWKANMQESLKSQFVFGQIGRASCRERV